MARLDPKRLRQIVRHIINKNFTFADLSNRFKNIDSSTGNFFCPFHDNHNSPAAKMYWDEDRDMWVIHCFGQCHRSFTAFDYVDLVLCEKYQRYRSPLDFLKERMPSSELQFNIEQSNKQLDDTFVSRTIVKENYINKVAEDYENTIDYIEVLYTA